MNALKGGRQSYISFSILNLNVFKLVFKNISYLVEMISNNVLNSFIQKIIYQFVNYQFSISITIKTDPDLVMNNKCV